MPRPTIADVARGAGVSKGAVSFALNNRPGVAPETRDRILAAAAELGWTPSHRARALAVSRALAVGLVIGPAPGDARRRPVLPRLHRRHRGDAVAARAVAAPAGRARGRRRARATGGSAPTAGSTASSSPTCASTTRAPRCWPSSGCRPSSSGPALTEASWPAVCVDDRPASRAAVEHLVELGHTRHRPRRRARRDRARPLPPRGLGGALHAAGLPEGPCVEADFSAEGGADATRELLDLPEPPTAIVYANDLMAIAGMAVAAAAASTSRASCPSPASTTPSSPRTSSRR